MGLWSKAFFKSINIPGVTVRRIQADPGHVHVTLEIVPDINGNIKSLCEEYRETCERQAPVGARLTVTAVSAHKGNGR